MSGYYAQQQQQQQQQPHRDSRNTAYAELFSRPAAASYPSARNTPPPGPSNYASPSINNSNSQPPYRQPQPGQRSSSAGSFRTQIGGAGGNQGGGASGQRSSYYPPSSESSYSSYQQQPPYQDPVNPARQLQYSSPYQQYQSPDLYQGS